MFATVKPRAGIPAVQGRFGVRLATYTTQLPAGSVETILGHDPRSKHWRKLPDDISEIYSNLQRATKPARLESVIRYMRYRFSERPVIVGAFPAISIAVQNPTPFQPIEGADSGVGVLNFDLSRRNLRIIVDGLARVSAALELVEISESLDVAVEERNQLRKLLDDFNLPTVFYVPAPGQLPLELSEMQQLFHDFNFKITPVPPRVAIALDHSDLYIGLTDRIANSDIIVRSGKMEKKSASLGKKSTAIVVQQNLLRFVRGATEGERFIEGKTNRDIADPHLTEDTINDFEDGLVRFLEKFVEGMGADAFKNRESLHLTSPGWGALGVIYHDLAVTLKVPDIDKAARRIGAIPWHRSAAEWKEIVREKIDKNGNSMLGLAAGGAQSRRLITKTIRETLKIDALLAECEPAVEAA